MCCFEDLQDVAVSHWYFLEMTFVWGVLSLSLTTRRTLHLKAAQAFVARTTVVKAVAYSFCAVLTFCEANPGPPDA